MLELTPFAQPRAVTWYKAPAYSMRNGLAISISRRFNYGRVWDDEIEMSNVRPDPALARLHQRGDGGIA